jgi:MerR family copper efflux transcriptional regulator
MEVAMNIGDASALCGLPVKTIRYYEDIGLVEPARRDNGYRDYVDSDVGRLRFLQRARNLGFSIETCRSLLELQEDKNRESAKVKRIALEHLEEIDRNGVNPCGDPSMVSFAPGIRTWLS